MNALFLMRNILNGKPHSTEVGSAMKHPNVSPGQNSGNVDLAFLGQGRIVGGVGGGGGPVEFRPVVDGVRQI